MKFSGILLAATTIVLFAPGARSATGRQAQSLSMALEAAACKFDFQCTSGHCETNCPANNPHCGLYSCCPAAQEKCDANNPCCQNSTLPCDAQTGQCCIYSGSPLACHWDSDCCSDPTNNLVGVCEGNLCEQCRQSQVLGQDQPDNCDICCSSNCKVANGSGGLYETCCDAVGQSCQIINGISTCCSNGVGKGIPNTTECSPTTQTCCTTIGNNCAANSECCSGNCDLAKTKTCVC